MIVAQLGSKKWIFWEGKTTRPHIRWSCRRGNAWMMMIIFICILETIYYTLIHLVGTNDNSLFCWNFQIRIFLFIHLSLTCTKETASNIVSSTKVYYTSAMRTDRLAFLNFLQVRELKKWKFREKKCENRQVWPSQNQSDNRTPPSAPHPSHALSEHTLLAVLVCVLGCCVLLWMELYGTFGPFAISRHFLTRGPAS